MSHHPRPFVLLKSLITQSRVPWASRAKTTQLATGQPGSQSEHPLDKYDLKSCAHLPGTLRAIFFLKGKDN